MGSLQAHRGRRGGRPNKDVSKALALLGLRGSVDRSEKRGSERQGMGLVAGDLADGGHWNDGGSQTLRLMVVQPLVTMR